VLFDTGLGIGSIRSQVDDATAHEAGVEHHRAGPPAAWLRAYLRNVEVFHDDYVKDEQTDRCGFNLLAPEMKMPPFPTDFDPASWEILPKDSTDTLSDGDSIDLGGRALTVVHSPGHTPDSICLLTAASCSRGTRSIPGRCTRTARSRPPRLCAYRRAIGRRVLRCRRRHSVCPRRSVPDLPEHAHQGRRRSMKSPAAEAFRGHVRLFHGSGSPRGLRRLLGDRAQDRDLASASRE
jgi:hypothetical protein